MSFLSALMSVSIESLKVTQLLLRTWTDDLHMRTFCEFAKNPGRFLKHADEG